MPSLLHRTARDVIGDLHAQHWKPVHPQARRVGWYGWMSPDETTRIGIDVARPDGPSSRLVIRRKTCTGWHKIADCRFDSWQTAVDIIAAYGLVSLRSTAGYRLAERARRAGR